MEEVQPGRQLGRLVAADRERERRPSPSSGSASLGEADDQLLAGVATADQQDADQQRRQNAEQVAQAHLTGTSIVFVYSSKAETLTVTVICHSPPALSSALEIT